MSVSSKITFVVIVPERMRTDAVDRVVSDQVAANQRPVFAGNVPVRLSGPRLRPQSSTNL